MILPVLYRLRRVLMLACCRLKNLFSGVVLTLTGCTGDNIISLSVTGNSTQEDTPAPDSPVEILNTGDKVLSTYSDWNTPITYGKTDWIGEKPSELGVDCYRIPIRVKSPNLPPIKKATIKAINTSGTWTGDTYTRNGITFVCNFDASGDLISVLANGTATNLAQFFLVTAGYAENSTYNLIVGKSYKLFGCPSGGATDTYQLRLDYSPSGSVMDNGAGATFTADSTKRARMQINVFNGVTLSNKVFTPAIYDSANAALPFQPYHMPYVYNIYLDAPLRYGDTLDNAGLLTRKQNSVTFDGTEPCRKADGTAIEMQVTVPAAKLLTAGGSLIYYKCSHASSGSGTEYVTIFNPANPTTIEFRKIASNWGVNYETADWQAFLASSPVTVEYELATPASENITMPAQIETFPGTTLIQLDTKVQPAVMEAEYWSTEEA